MTDDEIEKGVEKRLRDLLALAVNKAATAERDREVEDEGEGLAEVPTPVAKPG